MKQSVEIYIDELVLHGFSPLQGHHIRAAIEAELSSLLIVQGIPAGITHGGETPFINAGVFNIGPSAKPVAIGKNIADSVYNGFSNEK